MKRTSTRAGTEPSSHPIWVERAKELASLLHRRMTPADLLVAARKEFRWSPNLANNVLAYADGKVVYYKNGYWYKYPAHGPRKPQPEEGITPVQDEGTRPAKENHG